MLKVKRLLKDKLMPIIHTTIGVYPDGTFKINGVSEANLDAHIQYNLTNRWGRALFVDGNCIHKATLKDAQVVIYEKLFKSDIKYSRHIDTQPYQ